MEQVSSPIVIALLTDFGQSDGYVGVMKGVISGIAPFARLIDITHEIAPQHIAAGAWILSTSYRYFPHNTVFVCVVDPGVGSSRRSIAMRAGNWYFVGPDNGLFHYVLADQPVHEVVVLDQAAYHLNQVSSTFHGRDVFSPAAAHIAAGTLVSRLGSAVAPATLQRLETTLPQRKDDAIIAQVVHIDHFGNIITSIPLHQVADLFERSQLRLVFPTQRAGISERRRIFASEHDMTSDEQPFIYGDSSGHIAVAVRNGNAARILGVSYGAPVTLILGEK